MKLVKGVLVAGAVLAANGVSADMMSDINPIVGVDYYQAWMKGKNSFANSFPKSYPSATVYAGAKFLENFGAELGYNISARKKHDLTKVRRSGGYLDLVGYLPVMESVDLTASIGYGWIKTKIEPSSVFHAKNKGVFRLGVGANYMVTDMIGLRGKVSWENTGALRVNSTKAFKDTIALAIGAFAKF